MSKVDEAIISIHPKYVEAILRGEKTIELRRRIPNIQIGTRLWIYSTRPQAAIVGTAIVGEIHRESPSAIWKRWSTHMCVSQEAYDDYFHDSNVAIAICLTNVFKYRPIAIEQLRAIKPNFHPPQVIAKISKFDFDRLSQIAKSL